MASIKPATDETAMLAAGLGLGDYAFRVDLKKLMRCVALPSNMIGNFEFAGTPSGCSIYQDEITSEWMVSRDGEAYTPFAMSTEPPPVGNGSGDMLAVNNLSDLTNAGTARTNLGLGTLATQSGTFSGTSSGTNTGDNAVNSLYSGLVSNATHTGDATGGTTLTLATVNSTVGTFGSASQVAQVTVDAKGRVTAVSNVAITASPPNWHGVVYGAFGDCNPQTMMTLLHCAGTVAPTPTNIGTSTARLAYFTPPANITVNRIRFYGVGATTNVYRVAIYDLATLARLTAEIPFTTASGTWGAAGSSLGLSLVAGTRYLIAVSVNATGTTAGIAAFGPSTAVTTGGQAVVPTSFPGSLDFDSGYLTGSFATATVVTGALPATLGTPAAMGNWTGGFPAFWLDSNNA